MKIMIDIAGKHSVAQTPLWLILFLTFLIISCGGGSSDSKSPPPAKTVNQPPSVDAGEDKTVEENTTITLSGSGKDPDGIIVSYSWTQTSGKAIVLSDANSASTSFTTPTTDEPLVLRFELTVTDDDNATATDSVNITVESEASSKVSATLTEYNYSCFSDTKAVAWHNNDIAIIFEGDSALNYDAEVMTKFINFIERLYAKLESITGLVDLPLAAPWQNRLTIQIPIDNCGAHGLANHGTRGMSVGLGGFEEQYAMLINGEDKFMHVFFYEANRNFWLPKYNDYIDWAMDDNPNNWGWWTVGMNNAMAVILPALLEVEFDLFGMDKEAFSNSMLENYYQYRDNTKYSFDYGWRQEYMPWDLNNSVNDLMTGMILHSYTTFGGEQWLKNLYSNITTVPPTSDVFAYQAYRNNIYTIWSRAAGVDLKEYFVNELRWHITDEEIEPAPLVEQLNLADIVSGGNGTFPGTGIIGGSIIGSLNYTDFYDVNDIVDGAFVPQHEKMTTISTSGLQFDFSQQLAISLHDGAPTKGTLRHTDPSLQSNNLGLNPDYTGIPDKHAFINMHATLGVTFSLAELKARYENNVSITQFSGRFGKATSAKINFWVLLDGNLVQYGELLDSAPQAIDVIVDLNEQNNYLTLVIGDANTGTINNAHGYIGDPVLLLSAEEATAPAKPLNPTEGADVVAWQPLSWESGFAVNRYDIYLWQQHQPEPLEPSYSVTSNSVIPFEYLDYGKHYQWRIVSHLGNSSLTSPIYSFNVLNQDQIIEPAYNISPAAQQLREHSYSLNGLEQLSSENSQLKAGMRIGFYGDSNTDNINWQLPLVNILTQSEVISLNRGINGADVRQLWEGVRNYDAGGGLIEPKPFKEQIKLDNIDIAVIYIGINDVLNNHPSTTAETYKSYLNMIVEACASNDIKVILVAPATYNEKPDGTNLYDEQLDQYQLAAEQVAQQWGGTFVPARSHFINYLKNHNFSLKNDGQVLHPYQTGLLNYDAVHHNDKGRELLSNLVAEAIYRALTE